MPTRAEQLAAVLQQKNWMWPRYLETCRGRFCKRHRYLRFDHGGGSTTWSTTPDWIMNTFDGITQQEIDEAIEIARLLNRFAEI